VDGRVLRQQMEKNVRLSAKRFKKIAAAEEEDMRGEDERRVCSVQCSE
jgi:hypothetical protein